MNNSGRKDTPRPSSIIEYMVSALWHSITAFGSKPFSSHKALRYWLSASCSGEIIKLLSLNFLISISSSMHSIFQLLGYAAKTVSSQICSAL